MIRSALLFINCLVFTGLAQAKETKCIAQANDILDKISCLESVVKVSEVDKKGNLREIHIEFRQPADHGEEKRGSFNQKLVLLHRSENEPMVLQTSGYMIYRIAETAIARMFQTNQLQVEHRFFADSVPQNKDWGLLNVQQSAVDFHNITVAFKKIYTKNWVNTGASKGGMTSSYHRFMYPNDLNGTVADVAPLSFSRSDQRYNQFVRNVGGEKYRECRAELAHFQKHMLKHREKYIDRVTGDFKHLGGPAIAFEHAVIEFPFYFWQYGDPDSSSAGCPGLPDHHDDNAMFSFLNYHSRLSSYEDGKLTAFMPYFYQAATQLGAPDNVTNHLEPYRLFEFGLEQYTPKNTAIPYDNSLMRAVSKWVKTSAEKIMFIYGTYDPWTAAEYDIGQNEKASKYYVPGGNHSAKFTQLPSKEKALAIAQISEWLDKEPVLFNTQIDIFGKRSKTLHQLEFEAKRELGIR